MSDTPSSMKEGRSTNQGCGHSTRHGSVKKNVALNTLRTVTGLLFPIITFPYTSRVLGPEGVGKIQFATSFVGYFTMLAAFGIPLYGIRQIAKARDNRVLLGETAQELLFLNVCNALVMMLVLYCIVPFHPKLANERMLFSIASCSILLSALGMEWLYQGEENYAYITVRSLIVSTLSTASIFIFVHRPQDYLVAAAIYVAATLGSSVLNFWNARGIVFGRRSTPLFPWKHLKPLLMVFALNFIVSIYINLDTVMLGFMSDSRSVGYYATAMRLTKILLMVVVSMGAVLVPRLSYYVEHNLMQEFDTIVEKSFALVTLLCLPCTAALMILSREILLVFAGNQFGESGRCMVLTAPVIFMIGITNIMGIQILYPLGKEKLVVLSVSVGAVVSVILNLLLIPHLAHVGAAIGALVSEGAVFVIQVYLIARYRPVRYPWAPMVRYLFATCLMSAFLFLTPLCFTKPPLRLAVAIIGGSLTYFGSLLLLKDRFLLENILMIRQKINKYA